MAIEVINRGTSANDGTGDNIREAFRKVNDNFDQVLTNDTTDYTDATTPLAGTEIALVEQGGTFKKVAVSEFGGGGKRIAICDLGKFRIQVSAINNYVMHTTFGTSYNPSLATGISDHSLLNPEYRSVIYKVPFDCSLEEIVLSMSTGSDGSFSIWKTAPNSFSSIPIELYHIDDSSNEPYKQFIVNSALIEKDSFIHIFYARRSATSAWYSSGFLRFKEV